ncbi:MULTISPECIES: DUF4381 domain-containing protein [Aliiglaciecola]|uniref:DUF4381 domain-containing protein n=1 Tax=Aliiglaciecola TaxID=1406885 RepID=UPI001C07FFC6|nr:DUF4381 domain-containing protein [Aliiglaciecola lipolytica]MBU2878043.1 DUF4381 domain-containing protein [Aliiglaciecola lipolytica]
MNPLDQLADIQLPQEVSIWPLAWGWWVSAILVLLILVSIIYGVRHYILHRRAKKAALLALSAIDLNQQNAISQINIVLKRAALSYFPQEQIASLHGQQWSAFLSSQLSAKQQQSFQHEIQEFVDLLYRDAPNKDVNKAALTAKTWLQSALPPKRKSNRPVLIEEAPNV